MWKFDPLIREPRYYRRSLSFINGLLTFVFLLAGTMAFYFDHVTLLGRSEIVEFSGKWAHGAGVASFFVAAYWIYQSLQEYRVSLLVLLSPFAGATVISAILLGIKYT